MASLDQFYVKTPDQIRDDMLRTYANALIRRGIANPNVSYGTVIYAKFNTIANQIAVATSNTSLAADAALPDTAQGDDLKRLAKIHDLELRNAGGSTGPLVVSVSVASPVLIPTGSQLTDSTGLKYEVSVGGSFSDGDTVEIDAIDTGTVTNLEAGTVLKWASAPPFVSQNATVGTGGLTGGVNAEDIEDLRTRLLEYLSTPPASGNWSETNRTAEEASVAVQKAFTYACANGPGTVHVAVVRAPTDTNKGRDVDSLIVSNAVQPALTAMFPEFVECVTTTVQNQTVNATIKLSLPISTEATPAGPGGGWLDATPFPVYNSTGKADVTSVTSTTQFSVNSTSAPVNGVSRICWLSPLDWTLYTATVISSSGSGPYALTIDKPFVGIATGHFISPQAARIQEYFDAFLDLFANLGPGTKSYITTLSSRSARKPLVSQSWPSDLTSASLKFMTNAGDEVGDADWWYRSASTPSTPAAVTDGPYILVPNNLALYPL